MPLPPKPAASQTCGIAAAGPIAGNPSGEEPKVAVHLPLEHDRPASQHGLQFGGDRSSLRAEQCIAPSLVRRVDILATGDDASGAVSADIEIRVRRFPDHRLLTPERCAARRRGDCEGGMQAERGRQEQRRALISRGEDHLFGSAASSIGHLQNGSAIVRVESGHINRPVQVRALSARAIQQGMAQANRLDLEAALRRDCRAGRDIEALRHLLRPQKDGGQAVATMDIRFPDQPGLIEDRAGKIECGAGNPSTI